MTNKITKNLTLFILSKEDFTESEINFLNSNFKYILHQTNISTSDLASIKYDLLLHKVTNDYLFIDDLEKIDVWYKDLITLNPEKLLRLWVKIKLDKKNELISVFTTSYKSKEMIFRPYNSLLKQSYTKWEWVIMDDSPEDPENFRILSDLAESDNRIRVYTKNKNSGLIGEVKNCASSLCRGIITVELDHDDKLMPFALKRVWEAFNYKDNVDFVYSDCIHMNAVDDSNLLLSDNNKLPTYGGLKNMKYSGERYEWYDGRWYTGLSGATINSESVCDLKTVPNHLRAWRTNFLQNIGGYNSAFSIADDYELILRTVLYSNEIVRIPDFCYIHYLNPEGNNFSLIREEETKKMCEIFAEYYIPLIDIKFQEIKQISDDKYIETTLRSSDMISVIYYTNKGNHDIMKKIIDSVLDQSYSNIELIIVGNIIDIPTEYHINKVKWFNTGNNLSYSYNYGIKFMSKGKYFAYINDSCLWRKDHLMTLSEYMKNFPEITFSFSSLKLYDLPVIVEFPKKDHIRSTTLLHHYSLIEKYGLWQNGDNITWLLVERWFNEGERWRATKLITTEYLSTFYIF